MPLPRIATPWSLPPRKALANQAKGTWRVGFSQGSWDKETFLLVLVDPRPSQGSLEGGREAGWSEPEKDMWWERERKPDQMGKDSARPALRGAAVNQERRRLLVDIEKAQGKDCLLEPPEGAQP